MTGESTTDEPDFPNLRLIYKLVKQIIAAANNRMGSPKSLWLTFDELEEWGNQFRMYIPQLHQQFMGIRLEEIPGSNVIQEIKNYRELGIKPYIHDADSVAPDQPGSTISIPDDLH